MAQLVNQLYSIKDFDLKNKRVFVRTDFNAGTADHIRFQSALPTLHYVLKNGGKLIVGSHRGRPQVSSERDKSPSTRKLSLESLGAYLSQHLQCEVIFVPDLTQVPSILFSSLSEKRIILLENLRFHLEEEQGSNQWAEALSRFIDIYINEAFSVSHRNHTSLTLLPQKVKKRGMGLSLKKEISKLDYLRNTSPPPFVLLAGGVKVSDKIKALSKLSDRVDSFLIGGAMAYTFLKAKGVEVGEAVLKQDSLREVSDFMERLKIKKKKLFLPVDHLVIPANIKINTKGVDQCHLKVIDEVAVPKGFLPLDIGPKTIKCFAKALKGAGTVFWNGPMGKFEDPVFAKGTLGMCQAISECEGAFRVAGGGDSISAIMLMKTQESFDYISTGGGACLRYLERGQLPGLESLLMRA